MAVNDALSGTANALKSGRIKAGIDPGLTGIDPEGVAPGMAGLISFHPGCFSDGLQSFAITLVLENLLY
jgi:hypothetical protein